MGRKPNALILQHFERGPKLNDSSNRYEHTCKGCGEKFPKGRIDSLTAHILKKCVAMRDQDRQRAQLEFSHMNDLHNQVHGHNGEVQMKGKTVDLPIVNGNWSALETLAEVSRQIDLNEHKHDGTPSDRGPGMAGPSGNQRADRLELQEQYTLDNPPVSYEQRVLRDRKAANQKFNRGGSESSLPANSFNPNMSSSRSASPNLAMAASSIAAAQAHASRFTQAMVDPQLLAEELNGNIGINERTLEQQFKDVEASLALGLRDNFFPPEQQQQNPWTNHIPMMESPGPVPYTSQEQIHPEIVIENPTTPRAPSYPQLAANSSVPLTTQFSAEYGSGAKTAKPKPRSRFNQDRRKEVQALRQMGACIRCRMLKKPCSTGTPCRACHSVESARVWKQQCIRTRMANALEMYSAGLHVVLASRQVTDIKTRTPFQKSVHQIEASHYPASGIFTIFSALEGQSGGNIDPGLSGDFSMDILRLIDVEKDDPPKIIEAYMKKMLGHFIENEISNFMKITLVTARELLVTKDDLLLTRALHFWGVVHILVDHELAWNITDKVDSNVGQGEGLVIDQSNDTNIYNLLCLQLNAAAEMKAAELCKSILGDLERRLLTKDSSESFEIFIATIIILNCIEKSTWLFKSWEQPSFESRWPLAKAPDHFVQQGELVADLLFQLLTIRHIPPRTTVRAEDGLLAADSAHEMAQSFYQQQALSFEHVANKQENCVFDQSDSRCYELRYCSRLLLPPSSS